MYKGEVKIPALGMIDDLITISESGYKRARMNSFINAKIAIKKLQLGPKKCFVMHIKKDHEEFKNIEVYADGWKMKSVKDVETGAINRIDTFEGDMEISHISEERYIGQIISSDGKNIENIEKIRNKGIGLQNKVIRWLKQCLGLNSTLKFQKYIEMHV